MNSICLVESVFCQNSCRNSFIMAVVASSSELKLVAVRNALQEVSARCSRSTIVTPCEQPIGQEMALKCAHARFEAALLEVEDDTTLVVAIENFIVNGHGDWHDCCLVMMGTRLRRVFVVGSMEVHIPLSLPTEYADTSITIGKLVAAQHSHINHADWFKAIGCNFSRIEQMEDAVRCASGKFQLFPTQETLRTFPDYPTPSVSFIDIFSLMSSLPWGTRALVNMLRDQVESHCIEKPFAVAGLESRGLALGMALAYSLECNFVPLRKPGKLPGPYVSRTYDKEYGKDTLEVQTSYVDSLPPRLIVLDDVLATGGSADAACALVERGLARKVALVLVLMDVPPLRPKWRAALAGRRVAVCMS